MKRELRVLAVTLGIFATFSSIDVIYDLRQGSEWSHVALEIATILVAFNILYRLVKSFFNEFQIKLNQSSDEVATWKESSIAFQAKAQKFVKGLSWAFDHQFDEWGFSKAEKEIALLIIKGLSMREISTVRDVKEKTVRQQTISIYRKSSLNGRAELAAYFLEELLQPPVAMA